MIHLYSRGCEYVILVLAHLKPADLDNGFSLKELCRVSGTPPWYTRKIFQLLAKRGLVLPKRGPNGGYRFARPLKQISMMDVIEAIDGKNVFKQCILRKFGCGKKGHCSLHPYWQKARQGLTAEFKSITLDHWLNHHRNGGT